MYFINTIETVGLSTVAVVKVCGLKFYNRGTKFKENFFFFFEKNNNLTMEIKWNFSV